MGSRRVKDLLNDYESRRAATVALVNYEDPECWDELMLFLAKNRALLDKTDGAFPGGLLDDRQLDQVHPALIRENLGFGAFTFSPCTKKVHPLNSYIPRGTRTAPFDKSPHYDTYILRHYSFNVIGSEDFRDAIEFFGIVPETAIVGADYRQGKRR